MSYYMYGVIKLMLVRPVLLGKNSKSWPDVSCKYRLKRYQQVQYKGPIYIYTNVYSQTCPCGHLY